MKKLAFTLGLLVLLPTVALAHVGDHTASSFASGLMHPLSGADHFLAMVAVGLWAAMMGGRALWALPLSFVGAMLVGGFLGAVATPMPGVEPMILVSIVLLGGAIALALRLPLWAAMVVVAVFGVFHGHAHGTEGPMTGLAEYAVAFSLSTMVLHSAGIALGLGLNALSWRGFSRVLGAGAAAAGLALSMT